MPVITADDAFMIVKVFEHPALEIMDGQIDQANDRAAELHGYARARDLVGRFLSDLQLPQSRDAGSTRWALRQEGFVLPPDYCTLIRRPDGEVAGHRGELVCCMAGIHGKSYLTALQPVRELDEPPVLDLEAYGVSEETKLTHTGRFTVAKVRAMSRKQLTLHYGERVTMIIDECERSSTQYYGWRPGYGLDFALRGDLCTLSLSEKATTLVYYRHHDDTCGRAWDARTPEATQCPSCKAHLERGA